MNRITVNPAQCGGMACIRSLRIPVVSVLKMMASGMSAEEILREYPDLVIEDIHACLESGAIATVEDTRIRVRPLPIKAKE